MKWIAILGFALLAAGLFADVGPTPPKPDITVSFSYRGSPYAAVEPVVYHCIADEQALRNWGSTAAFACKNGACSNNEWNFYKLSPCFYPKSGYFTYMFNGTQMRSEGMNFNQGGSYDIRINAPTGEMASRSWSSGACAPAALLPAVLAALFLARNGKWN